MNDNLNSALNSEDAGDAIYAVGDRISNTLTSGKQTDEKRWHDLPGTAINAADKNAVNPSLVKERTCTLNNNPRNTDM